MQWCQQNIQNLNNRVCVLSDAVDLQFISKTVRGQNAKHYYCNYLPICRDSRHYIQTIKLWFKIVPCFKYPSKQKKVGKDCSFKNVDKM